jgi:D-alanyl-D-alanine carboxypeptidase
MKKLILLLLVAFSPLVFSKEKITATSWLVADGEGTVLESKNPAEPRSIASITKLMTAMVVLDANQDLDEKIGSTRRKDLLQLMLVKSDNHAAEKLCENYPGGRSSCIGAMNFKAWNLGTTHTRYADPSGLNIMNVSTAEELVKIVIEASKYPDIIHASNTAHGVIETKEKPKKKKKGRKGFFSYHNTNPLVATKEFIVSKTGYIRASGGCIVMMLDTKIGRRIVVLLNSKNTHTRIPEAELLATKF